MKIILATATATLLATSVAAADHHATPEDGPEAVARAIYDAFAVGDMAAFTALLHADIVWNEAEHYLYADRNPYEGPDAVLEGVFARTGADWEGFTATPERMIADEDEVAVTGRYTATHRATGEALDAQFAHVWTIEDGLVVRFQQYTDTWQAREVAGLD